MWQLALYYIYFLFFVCLVCTSDGVSSLGLVSVSKDFGLNLLVLTLETLHELFFMKF